MGCWNKQNCIEKQLERSYWKKLSHWFKTVIVVVAVGQDWIWIFFLSNQRSKMFHIVIDSGQKPKNVLNNYYQMGWIIENCNYSYVWTFLISHFAWFLSESRSIFLTQRESFVQISFTHLQKKIPNETICFILLSIFYCRINRQ